MEQLVINICASSDSFGAYSVNCDGIWAAGDTIDECKIRGEADLVIFPENAEDIAEVLRDAYGKSIPVTVSANRTGLCGGGVPDEGWVMSLEGMPGLIGMGQDDEGYYVRIGPGVSVRTLTDTMLLKRIEGTVDAVETPIGLVPKAEDINIEGLDDITVDTVKGLLQIDKDNWREEVKGIKEFYAKFGDKLPKELAKQVEELESKLA